MSRTGGSLILRFLAAQVVVVIAVVSVPWIVVAAYPGSLRPTGIVLCPDDKPDIYVVQYSETTSEGTGTNWTVFCLATDGEVEEVGSWAPLGVYLLGWLVLLELLVVPLVLLTTWRSRRRRRRRFPPPPRFDPYSPSAPGPQGPYR